MGTNTGVRPEDLVQPLARRRASQALARVVVASFILGLMPLIASAERATGVQRVPRLQKAPPPPRAPLPLALPRIVDSDGRIIGQILSTDTGTSLPLVTTSTINGREIYVSLPVTAEGFVVGGGLFTSDDCTGPTFSRGTIGRTSIAEAFWITGTILGTPDTYPTTAGEGTIAHLPSGEVMERTFHSQSHRFGPDEVNPCPIGFTIGPSTCCRVKTERHESVPTEPFHVGRFVPPFSLHLTSAASAH